MNEYQTEIAKAFIKAQSEMANAVKGTTNPFLKNKYADLNAVREAVIPTLNKHGIAVLQPLVTIDGKNYVKTLLLHESGQTMESLTEVIYERQNDAQAQGSGITYARRYGLQSLVCIGADDDDGNNASAPEHQEPPKDLPWLNILDKDKNMTKEWLNVIKGINEGKIKSPNDAKQFYKVSKEIEIKIQELLNNRQNGVQ
ncbi:ERF family protein [uncultured Capnocytophaga sp.]|uniref:ERF family protein n=1 Tax=uncultured Capnocytophaga sp. TaxID=159273 RepID=UPI0028F130DF|nr:ERF family protein [uncultured Capnocytophaga sp.]